MKWVNVSSSVIQSAAYEPSTETLYLKFKTGKIYRYLNFPSYQFEELLTSDSLGRYFGARIRDQFQDEQVDQKDLPEILSRAAGANSHTYDH